VTFEAVRNIALAFDQAEEVSSYGTPGFKAAGTLFARHRPEMEALVVRVDREQRQEMIAADPETYFLTDHYLDYPWILVRLARVQPEAMRDLLTGAWRLAMADKRRATRRRGPAR
jgi:hypothetical protein